jgi:hypothetical protein
MQAYPILVRNYPALRVVSLRESNPHDGVSGVGGAIAVRVEQLGAGEGGTVKVSLEVPTRSPRHMRLLEISDIRAALWRTLLIAAQPLARDEASLKAGVAGLEGDYLKTVAANAPRSIGDLVEMGILPADYLKDYEEKLGVGRGVGALGGGGGAPASPPRGGASPPKDAGGAGSARGLMSLWWPPRAGALTYKELQQQRQELAEAMKALKLAEKVEMREKMAAAAERRMAENAAAGGGGGGT